MANLCDNYPCHENLPPDFSCEFCYCPEYFNPKCSGNPKFEKAGNETYKDCSGCTINHTSQYITSYYKSHKNLTNPL